MTNKLLIIINHKHVVSYIIPLYHAHIRIPMPGKWEGMGGDPEFFFYMFFGSQQTGILLITMSFLC